MDEAAARVLGIHTTDLYAGEVLQRSGAMTISELARAVRLSPGAATALVDRLEAAGLAARVPDSKSRRQILVKPSREASRRVYSVFGGLIEKGDKFLDRYSNDELLAIWNFLRGARTMFIEHTDALRDRRPPD